MIPGAMLGSYIRSFPPVGSKSELTRDNITSGFLVSIPIFRLAFQFLLLSLATTPGNSFHITLTRHIFPPLPISCLFLVLKAEAWIQLGNGNKTVH